MQSEIIEIPYFNFIEKTFDINIKIKYHNKFLKIQSISVVNDNDLAINFLYSTGIIRNISAEFLEILYQKTNIFLDLIDDDKNILYTKKINLK